MNRISLVGLCVVSLLLLPSVVAQESVRGKPLALSIRAINRYTPGNWGVVGIHGVNRTDKDVLANVSVYLEKDSRTQFVRKLWVPAHTQRDSWLPIRVPDSVGKDRQAISASAVVTFDSSEVIARGAQQTLVTESLLPIHQGDTLAGAIYRHTPPSEYTGNEDLDWDAYEMLVMVRETRGGDRITVDLVDSLFPPFAEAYRGFDQLLICSDRWLDDSGGVAALRSWVAGGGRAWVMLDRASLDTVTTLVGNAVCCDIVDRVELTEFELETPALSLISTDRFERWESERPVDFVRVLVDDSARVHSRIDGWPAAFSIPMGSGEVLITTLGPRGWRYEEYPFADPQITLPTSGPTRALGTLADWFQQARPEHPVAAADLKPLLQEQIGYQIPSRKVAFAVLGANFLALLAIGLVLARRQKLEHLGWILPAIALASAGVMVAVGKGSAAKVPATAVGFQLKEVLPAGGPRAQTLVSFFSPESLDLPLATDGLAVAEPELGDLQGVMKQIVWDDDSRAHWNNMGVAESSARFVEIEDNDSARGKVHARGRFGPRGFEGELVGAELLGQAADAVLASPPAPSTAVDFDSDYHFFCRPGAELAPDEYLTDAVLSDEQQRRQEIYRQVLKPSNGPPFPRHPSLLVWGDSWQTRAAVPEQFERVGSTLWVVPLEIERTPRGAPFVVPAPFISMQNPGEGRGASGAYNPRTGRWTRDMNLGTESLFRFVLPKQILPCRLTRATFTLKVNAPSRVVQLVGVEEGTKQVIESRESPSGVLHFTVEDPRWLTIDEYRGLLFGVTVSPTQRQAEASRQSPKASRDRKSGSGDFDRSTWEIDYLRLSVAGEAI